jgi:hypothetical protein
VILLIQFHSAEYNIVAGTKLIRPNPSVTLRVGLGFNSNLTPIDPRFHKCVGQLELLVGYLAFAISLYL